MKNIKESVKKVTDGMIDKWGVGVLDGLRVGKITDEIYKFGNLNLVKYNLVNIADGSFVSDIWYDWIWKISNVVIKVKLNEKYNFMTLSGELMLDTWLDYVGVTLDGLTLVGWRGKLNYIDADIKLISDIWFDDAGHFENGFATVISDRRRYKINKAGRLTDFNY